MTYEKIKIEEIFHRNAQEVFKLATGFAEASVRASTDCLKGCGATVPIVCENCGRESANLHYFSVALGIVAAAVVDDRATVLFDVLIGWARENLPDYPHELQRPLYGSAAEIEFPEIIEERRPEARR